MKYLKSLKESSYDDNIKEKNIKLLDEMESYKEFIYSLNKEFNIYSNITMAGINTESSYSLKNQIDDFMQYVNQNIDIELPTISITIAGESRNKIFPDQEKLHRELDVLRGRILEYSNSIINNINIDINERLRTQYDKGNYVNDNKKEIKISINISNTKSRRYS